MRKKKKEREKMRGELYFESDVVGLSASRRGSYSRREECGYAALCGTAEDGTRYVTLTDYDPEDGDALAAAVLREFGRFLRDAGIKDPRSVLVAGIGNGRIEADSLGTLASERVGVGETERGIRVFSFAPGVPEATGIETEVLVPALARLVSADLLVAVDSLAALSPDRLFRAVQISGGARPGSGVVKGAGAIGSNESGCPVLTVGVPTAVRGRLSRGGDSAEGLFTSCDAGSGIVFHAAALAAAINGYCR
ncbi:MAG: GPR endopeptidase [Clostridia bacterium]|nr:GPR endopeptidase [Clostridia bacterium]MBR7033685.1 GPR endopeptidase [Clostridia bacterium]